MEDYAKSTVDGSGELKRRIAELDGEPFQHFQDNILTDLTSFRANQ